MSSGSDAPGSVPDEIRHRSVDHPGIDRLDTRSIQRESPRRSWTAPGDGAVHLLECVLCDPAEVAALSPLPTLGDLDRLVAETVESGTPVELRVKGRRRGLGPRLPARYRFGHVASFAPHSRAGATIDEPA